MNVRTLVVIGCAALASACFGTRSISGERLTSDHVAWIFETASNTGKWVGSLECDDAWVDAFADDSANLILVARDPELERNVYLSFPPGTRVTAREVPHGPILEHSEWFDGTTGGSYTRTGPAPIVPTRYTLKSPATASLRIGVHFWDPMANSYPTKTNFAGELRLVERR